MRGIRLVTVVAVISLVPAGALAAFAAGVKSSPPPVSGRWGIQLQGDHGYASGQFVVTPHHKAVRGFTVKPGEYASSSCGSGPIKVRGKPKIIHFTGINQYHLHYSIWAVAAKAHGPGDPIKPRKVTVAVGGDRIKGKMQLSFTRPRGGGITKTGPPKSNGLLSFRPKGKSRCGLGFFFKKK
jgi:hypothetical protein